MAYGPSVRRYTIAMVIDCPPAWNGNTPRAAANRTQGIGIRFPSDDKSKLLKVKIEEILGGALASERPTQTI